MEINGKPMIYWQLERLKKHFTFSDFLVATSDHKSDDYLSSYLNDLGVTVFRGPLANPLKRYLSVIEQFKPESFVRLTGDCPLVMPELIVEMVQEFNTKGYDYYSNVVERTYPDGLDVEIINSRSFVTFAENNLSELDLEHVTLGMYSKRSKLLIGNHVYSKNISNLRLTVDYLEDFDFISKILKHFKGRESEFELQELLNYLSKIRVPFYKNT